MKKEQSFGRCLKGMMVLIALLLCSSLQPALAAEPINIGFTSDFSGLDASKGMQEAPVVEMVVQQINKAGGINGRQLNLIIQDNGSDPAKALGNAKIFKEKYKCKVILAGVTSSVCTALKNWGDQNKIPVIAIDPQSDKLWVKSGKAWFFRTETPASPRVEAILARLKKLGHTKVAFEGTALAWGTDSLAVFKEKAPQFGIQIVSEVLIDPKTKDLSLQVKKLRDSGAQAVICVEYEAETAGLARAMSAIGWKPYTVCASAANMSAAMSFGSPELFNGWETVTQIDPTKPLVKKVWSTSQAFAAASGKKVTLVEDEKGPRAYDAISLLVAALKLSGKPDDSTAIRDALYKLNNYERALGPKGSKGGFVEGKNHLLAVNDLVISVAKGGKLVTAAR